MNRLPQDTAPYATEEVAEVAEATENGAKKPYAKPILRVYGNVETLTGSTMAAGPTPDFLFGGSLKTS